MNEVEPREAGEQFLALRFARIAGAYGVFSAVAGERRQHVIVRSREGILGFGRVRFREGTGGWSFVGHRRSLVTDLGDRI